MKSAAIANFINPGFDRAVGYQNSFYAHAFAEFGTPIRLIRSQGWLLKRLIPDTPWFDAMGCYPIFSCKQWGALAEDIEALKGSCITVTMVTDPFGEYTEGELRNTFPDLLIKFKKHYVIDLSRTADICISNHHRRNAKIALKQVAVEKCNNPEKYINEWMGLYGYLVQRHRIRGMLAFSKNCFLQMFKVPGIVSFRAISGSQTICMHLWYAQGDIAYYHLGASNESGYEYRAAFALFWTAIHYFIKQGFKWINLGGGAGLNDSQQCGLSRFKQGWANNSRTTYLCGRILNPVIYYKLNQDKGGHATEFFPAYRQGEF